MCDALGPGSRAHADDATGVGMSQPESRGVLAPHDAVPQTPDGLWPAADDVQALQHTPDWAKPLMAAALDA
jgi:hypothetical protein